MLNRLLLSLVLVVFLLLASRCKKEKKITECQGYVACPTLFKDFFVFKDSSYWIYRDSVNGDIDSVYVKNYENTRYWPYLEKASRDCPCYEEFKYSVIYQLSGSVENNSIVYSYQKNPVNLNKLTVLFKQAFSITNYEQSRFAYTFGFGFAPYPAYGNGIVDTMDSLQVMNKKFRELVYIKYPNASSFDWVRNIYYAKNIGAIKYKDNNGRVWELIRYKIKQ